MERGPLSESSRFSSIVWLSNTVGFWNFRPMPSRASHGSYWNDSSEYALVRRPEAGIEAAAQASCLRGELLRAYVRMDNALALEVLAAGYRLDPELIRQQTAARRALFATDPPNDALDQPDMAPIDAGLHCAHRILADDAPGIANLDPRQPREVATAVPEKLRHERRQRSAEQLRPDHRGRGLAPAMRPSRRTSVSAASSTTLPRDTLTR